MACNKQHRKSPSSFARSVGERIRKARRAALMSQEQLSQELELSFQQIQNYETGKSNLCGERIVQLCRVLKMEPNELLGWRMAAREKASIFFIHGNIRRLMLNYDAHLNDLFETRRLH